MSPPDEELGDGEGECEGDRDGEADVSVNVLSFLRGEGEKAFPRKTRGVELEIEVGVAGREVSFRTGEYDPEDSPTTRSRS
jgi:hypothetical protein